MSVGLKKVEKEIQDFVPKNKEDIEVFKLSFLGKKGVLASLFKDLKKLPVKEKRAFGASINRLKNLVADKLSSYENMFLHTGDSKQFDLSKPITSTIGSRHPLSLIKNEIIDIFNGLGFAVSLGPEIEDDWHNFSALNLPKEHPARDMQDTFFIDSAIDSLLRTHTSSVQIRYMKKNQPPIRTISPGRVYRNEAVSARSHCIFHQIEGLYIDVGVSFSDLKQIILHFAKKMFGSATKIRLRPSYFPFTEPSAEVDISCNICNQKGCGVCKNTGYVEILGCGLVDPVVLKNCGIDASSYSGFAFGMGVERIAMLKYGVDDLRLFFENDIRFLKQFSSL